MYTAFDLLACVFAAVAHVIIDLRSHCAAERLEWQLNNYRLRSRMQSTKLSLLPSGTSSNEALHAELNNWFRQHVAIHQATLRIKLMVLTFAKQLAHTNTSENPTMKQERQSTVLAPIVMKIHIYSILS